jgi:iron(III) transport system substrate-binding protein
MSIPSHFLSTYSTTRRTLLKACGVGVGTAALRSWPASASAEKLLWFAGSDVRAVEEWTNLFKAKTGISVEYYRAAANKLAQRFEQEALAKQVQCSIIDMGLPGPVGKWARRGLLMEYQSPEYAHYPADTVIPGFAGPSKADVLCIAYNSEIIRADEAPGHWEDLLDSKWKDKMTMSDAAASSGALQWYAAMRATYGRSYMERLAKQNVLVRQGSGEVVNTMISGERPLAAMILQYHVLGAIKRGAKLQIVSPDEGMPVSIGMIGIAASAPDPESAKRFLDFALGREAQLNWQENFFTSSLRDDVPGVSGGHGAKPLREVKRMASSAKDLDSFFEKQSELIDEWSALFK